MSIAPDMSLAETIRRAIAEPILSGTWQAGARIPSEHELMQDFSASRMTVHGVLANLAREGLIHRRRGAGSFVAERPPAHAVMEIVDVRREIEASGRRHAMKVITHATAAADETARHALNLATNAQVTQLVLVHLADGMPYQLEERFLNLDLLPPANRPPPAIVPYGGWLLTAVAWHEAEHIIRADAASGSTAQCLGLTIGAPVLIIERRTFLLGQTLTWVRLTHPASHHLAGRFKPPVA